MGGARGGGPPLRTGHNAHSRHRPHAHIGREKRQERRIRLLAPNSGRTCQLGLGQSAVTDPKTRHSRTRQEYCKGAPSRHVSQASRSGFGRSWPGAYRSGHWPGLAGVSAWLGRENEPGLNRKNTWTGPLPDALSQGVWQPHGSSSVIQGAAESSACGFSTSPDTLGTTVSRALCNRVSRVRHTLPAKGLHP